MFAPATPAVGLGALACATGVLHLAMAIANDNLAHAPSLVTSGVEYYAATVALVAGYIAVVTQVDASPSRRTWCVLIGVPLVIQVGWVLSLPVLAIDAYSYLVDAMHAHAGLNPYEHAVSEAAGTRLGQQLETYGWRPVHGISPYGPVWMHLARAIGVFATDIEIGVRVVKLIALAATALAAYVIFITAGPESRARAFTIFWWNPAVIIEGAGEGHNDAVMVLAVVVSLAALHARAPVLAAGALTVAVLTKWLPAIFGPIYLAYVWRTGLLTARAVIAGGFVIGGIIVAASWSFWSDGAMLNGIRRVGSPRFIASTTGVLRTLLPGSVLRDGLLQAAVALITIGAVVRGTFVTRTFEDLVRACATAVVVYLLVSSPLYWPWYVLLPIALLAMVGDITLVCVLTATSRLVAPLNLMRLRDAIERPTEVWLVTVVGLWIPLAYIIWRAVRAETVASPWTTIRTRAARRSRT